MLMPIQRPTKRAAASAIAAVLGFTLSACGAGSGMEANGSLYSVNQPVVERSNYTLDLATSAAGLPIGEQARLADWLQTLDAGYGDRVALDAPVAHEAVVEDIAAIAGRHGLLLAEGTPITEGHVDPGNIRVVVTRSHAYVPGCPNWDDKFGGNLGNNTTAGYGCAVNGNLAAMVADPEHLLEGAEGTGETVIMQSNKAIESFRERQPTGGGGAMVPEVASEGE